ncbi:MAG: hypothetical protein JXA78_02395 [Anaerolineales bacterium]|nr:hypothetical protein [Anaerolineales bacterium]
MEKQAGIGSRFFATWAATNQSYYQYLPLVAKQIPKPLGSLADGWYLMVDDGHIVQRDVARLYHPFRKHPNNPILRADKPWEGKVVYMYGAVLPGYRMWYSTYNKDWGVKQVLYAESRDGLNWRKPDLDGAGRNVMFGGQNANLVSVIHTPLEPDRPFKLMVYQNGAFQGYWSEDGVQAQAYPGNPLFYNGYDVAQFYWDPNTNRYGGTAKEITPVRGVQRRVVRFINSLNFTDWSVLPEKLEPDLLDDQLSAGLYPHFYGLPVFPSGEQYLGLLWVLKARDPEGLYGRLSIQLVSSHDGVAWIREEGERPPILDTGPPGAWDGGQVYTAMQPIKVGDELWLYYSGCDLEHGSSLAATTCSIGLATAPYNRLASLTGSGSALTDYLSPPYSRLRLNYEGRQGSIRVELSRFGEIIPGYEAENCLPLSGNSLDQIVAWNGQTGLPGGPFQIKFYLQNSALYAFSIREP